MAEPIFFNNNIKIDNRVLYREEWFEAGFMQISDMYADNGRMMNLEEFKELFDVNINFLEYYSLSKVVNEHFKKLQIEKETHNRASNKQAVMNLLCNLGNKSSKVIYKMLLSPDTQTKAMNKWNVIIGENLEWGRIFYDLRKITQDTKLLWFQMKILHRILSTNKYLKMIGIRYDDKCSFCKTSTEDINHLFWNCDIVQEFRLDFLGWVKTKCTHLDHFQLNLQFVIFGYGIDRCFDFLLLLAKYFIYKCKIQNIGLDMEHFKRDVNMRLNVEQVIACMYCKQHKFLEKWILYSDLFDI